MWSKEENDQLKENILEYCKVGMFCVLQDNDFTTNEDLHILNIFLICKPEKGDRQC